ncbi:unnamed protein product [Adineta steineri]|uniref:Malic enzyme n=2 Tax=Adineta steineri TaxID=433720 RepID=A0A818HFW8_9BILA|nr:unnamed protein product [Adineta steineri]CAF0852614.1 unnamed protein product [Adineta steineri]CAF0945644.1 unnamed protein product [Adineta steineri]CAF3507600.1 unnamed protein product [Adineta steineri]CAF3629543.1 unnamed protein product [Adineta steineri]
MFVKPTMKINQIYPYLSWSLFQRSIISRTNASSTYQNKERILLNCTNNNSDYKMTTRRFLTGYDVLLDRRANKGTAFSIEERQTYRIHGLLPPTVATPELQVERFMDNLRNMPDDLSRYIALAALQDRNEKLFYRVAMTYTQEIMPLVYTPTVGLACQKYGLIFSKPKGLFISINDKGHIYDVLSNWPIHDVRAIVVTDGERILGLGDLGCNGMGIPVGKLSLYTALAGVAPEYCLPITLDVGTNNETFLKDKYYLGLQHKRVTGKEYDEFIDEFMQAVVKRFGQQCLIQFEDFANHNAFRLLEKYREHYCTFNDDIQGTASVAVAGILSSLRITGRKLSDNTFVFYGAGEASIGMSDLLVVAMEREGVSVEDARKKIFLVDSKGLVVKDRPTGGLNEEKKRYAHERECIVKLGEIVKALKPSFLIGAAGQGPAFTREILEDMASFNEHPVIFALSNPTSKAECTASEAYEATKGQCVFASGSPFPNVDYNGKTYIPGQGNNSYIFPGVGLAIVTCGIRHIPEELFYISAKTLSEQVTEEDLASGLVYPPIEKIHAVSRKIAVALAEYSYEHKLAAHYPKPKDLEKYIEENQYKAEYSDALPPRWDWQKKN